MSRYSETVPSSHTPAYPHHHDSSYQHPQQSRQQQQDWPAAQPWSYYGPPPAVPASLYQTSSSASTPYGPFIPPRPPWEEDAEEKKRASKGRDYLRNLGSDLASMTLYDGVKKEGEVSRPRPSSQVDKPLPRVPKAPELQHRPHTEPVPPHLPVTIHVNAQAGPSSPPKTFKPSPYLILPSYHNRRPISDPLSAGPSKLSPLSHKPTITFPSTPPRRTLGKASPHVIDLTYSPASSSSTSATPPSNVTPRSPARLRKRATSEQPPTPTSASKAAGSARSPASKDTGTAVRCAGFTRAGQPCKRIVRSAAPLLASLDLNVSSGGNSYVADPGRTGASGDEVAGRYCKDHAGMICSASGFYPREKPSVWVAFDDWIPPELGQQTQTLIRMTMESQLTAKESPGFIYAYELRDLQTSRTSYFKVGRTDNVPRRIGQWTNQCTSKSPTLRDIFPLPSAPLASHHQTPRSGSLLPGALGSGTLSSTPDRSPSIAMKRWERLIHLELADLAARERPMEWESDDLKGKCTDCGVVHKEVFPVARTPAGGGGGEGEGCYQVVLEVICRWERYIAFAHGNKVDSTH